MALAGHGGTAHLSRLSQFKMACAPSTCNSGLSVKDSLILGSFAKCWPDNCSTLARAVLYVPTPIFICIQVQILYMYMLIIQYITIHVQYMYIFSL